MTNDLEALKLAETRAVAALTVAVGAVDTLMVAREALPALIDDYRRRAASEHAVGDYAANTLYAHPSALARYLLSTLSNTVLGGLILDHGRQVIEPYRGQSPAQWTAPAPAKLFIERPVKL